MMIMFGKKANGEERQNDEQGEKRRTRDLTPHLIEHQPSVSGTIHELLVNNLLSCTSLINHFRTKASTRCSVKIASTGLDEKETSKEKERRMERLGGMRCCARRRTRVRVTRYEYSFKLRKR